MTETTCYISLSHLVLTSLPGERKCYKEMADTLHLREHFPGCNFLQGKNLSYNNTEIWGPGSFNVQISSQIQGCTTMLQSTNHPF